MSTCRAKKPLLPVVFFETKPHLLRFLYGTTSKTTGGSVYLALSARFMKIEVSLEVTTSPDSSGHQATCDPRVSPYLATATSRLQVFFIAKV